MNFEPTTITTASISLVLGLFLLFKSADWLVSGAVSLAKSFGVSSLLIGLTIVAMGTSAPEVAASITSSLKDAGDVAIGNVFGSNIANLALIGGICALIRPLSIKASTLKREMPIMIGVALILFPILMDLKLTFLDGTILVLLFLLFTYYNIVVAIKQAKIQNSSIVESIETNPQIKDDSRKLSKDVFLVVLGIGAMALAAKLTVDGGVFLGRSLGLSEAVIGMSVIAIGTSLPELITCVVAALKGHDDISIGNLVGSNIFNTLLVTGVAGISRPFEFEEKLAGSYFWIMIGATLLFFVLVLHKKTLSKPKGLLLLAYYALYISFIIGKNI
jgi:cation:H+ antiporter